MTDDIPPLVDAVDDEDEMLEDLAARRGMTVEELLEQWDDVGLLDDHDEVEVVGVEDALDVLRG